MSEDKDTTSELFRLTEPPSWGEVQRLRAKAAARRHYLRNKERYNLQARAYRSAHFEKMERSRMNSNMRKFYGITLDERDALIVAQDACCAACGRRFGEGLVDGPHVDHCHVTGRVRGILCSNCNKALGLARDNPDVLRALADYLERLMA